MSAQAPVIPSSAVPWSISKAKTGTITESNSAKATIQDITAFGKLFIIFLSSFHSDFNFAHKGAVQRLQQYC